MRYEHLDLRSGNVEFVGEPSFCTPQGSPSRFRGRVGHIIGVAFTPDGTRIIAVGTGDTRVWSCDFCGPIRDVFTTAQSMATRTLTSAERALYLHER